MSISIIGTHRVRITVAEWRQSEKTSELFAAIAGVTATGETETGFLYCGQKVILGGLQKGKTKTEATLETLRAIGLPGGDPGQLAGIVGMHCVFAVVAQDANKLQYGPTRVAFVNAPPPTANAASVTAYFETVGVQCNQQQAQADIPDLPPAEDGNEIPF